MLWLRRKESKQFARSYILLALKRFDNGLP